MKNPLKQTEVVQLPMAAAHSEDHLLFPTPVRVLRWKTEEGFNERLTNYCTDLHESTIKGRLPYYTYNLFNCDLPELARLKNMYEIAMRDYISEHMNAATLHNYNYRMRGWLRIDKPKEVIPPHAHFGHHLVGTYYCQVDVADQRGATSSAKKNYADGYKEGDLVMLDPRPGVKIALEKSRKGAHSITPEVGMMILMPCFLYHWVNPISDGDRRICIANNLALDLKKPLDIVGSFDAL